MSTYYGFARANRAEEPAWFHTRAAAERFSIACGDLGEIETTDKANPGDILDTPEEGWPGRA